MKHSILTKVKVISITDETGNMEYLNKIGTVIDYNINEATGNTDRDPLHVVAFEGLPNEEFWYEELTIKIEQEIHPGKKNSFEFCYGKNCKNICYTTESGTSYTYNQFLTIAKGNPRLAAIIFNLCEWQHPETVFEELLREGEIDEHGKILEQE